MRYAEEVRRSLSPERVGAVAAQMKMMSILRMRMCIERAPTVFGLDQLDAVHGGKACAFIQRSVRHGAPVWRAE